MFEEILHQIDTTGFNRIKKEDHPNSNTIISMELESKVLQKKILDQLQKKQQWEQLYIPYHVSQ